MMTSKMTEENAMLSYNIKNQLEQKQNLIDRRLANVVKMRNQDIEMRKERNRLQVQDMKKRQYF